MAKDNSKDGRKPKPGNRGGRRDGRSGGQRGQPQSRRGDSRRGSSGRADKGHGGDRHAQGASRQRRDLKGAASDLPRWVVDALTRVTPKDRVGPALEELGEASNAMIEGRYKSALRAARKAKDLAPRDATVRETLGLAAYRCGDWQTALRELRTYRRFSGEPTHLPVEMDVLRALGRSDDVVRAWEELRAMQSPPAVHKEGVVVYASHLIDEGKLDEAQRLATPQRLSPKPYPADLRVWYVAARANALAGDSGAARQLADAIVIADPGFPGMDDLESTIAKAAP